jgi:metal-responsive CopG/Arc/MetJ family transcriptional regulator
MGKNIRTTVSLPEELLAATDRAVSEGRARSRNEFLGMALQHELAALERARIDEAFTFMAEDPLYADVAEELAGEFDGASWEALRAVERRSGGREAGG